MIDYILLPSVRKQWPDLARAVDALDATDPAFDDWPAWEHAELAECFARKRRERELARTEAAERRYHELIAQLGGRQPDAA